MRIGRNAPCWCGSGLKYKRCHLRREHEPPVGHQEIIDRIRDAEAGCGCLHPEAPENCSGEAIQSHSITRSGGLSEIAEEGHVMTFYADYGVFLRTDGDVEPRRVGIRKASSFPAFCSYHDSFTFGPVEKGPYSPCEMHAFLTSYRALCRELFVRMRAGEWADLDRGMPPVAQVEFQQAASAKEAERLLALRSLYLLKTDYDSALRALDFSRMNFYSIELAGAPDVMVSSLFAPFANFRGERIRHTDVLGTKNDHMIVSLFASGAKGWFQLAWLGESKAGLKFTQSFAELPDDQMPHAIVRLVFSHFENRYFRPSWWKSLPANYQEVLHRRFWNPQNPFASKRETYLQDDGLRLVNWRIVARTTNIDLEGRTAN